jgi:DNA repair exonuclease SbcCD nuclease subunit
MKMAVFSDIQYNPWKEHSKLLPNGRNSRLEDQLNAQGEIFDFCIQRGVDILVHTGDLFEALTEKIDKATFLIVYDKFVEFSKSGVIVVLLVGNHDWLDRTETTHILEPFKEIPNVIVADRWRIEFLDGISLGFIPYTKGDFKGIVSQMVHPKRMIRPEQYPEVKYKYLFAHQAVSGARVGPRDIVLKTEYGISDFMPDYFDAIFCGHYHKMQTFGSNFIIVGSTLQKDQGERNDQKGFWFLDTEVVPKQPFFIETHAPKFFKIELGQQELQLPKGFCEDKDFLWIISSNEEVLDSKIVKDLGGRVKVDIQSEVSSRLRSDISINMSIEEQIKSYVALHGGKLDKDALTKMGVEKWKRSQ